MKLNMTLICGVLAQIRDFFLPCLDKGEDRL